VHGNDDHEGHEALAGRHPPDRREEEPGRSSGGPPGTLTIARGLLRVRAAADALESLTGEREMR
jgi:hypothetical protein